MHAVREFFPGKRDVFTASLEVLPVFWRIDFKLLNPTIGHKRYRPVSTKGKISTHANAHAHAHANDRQCVPGRGCEKASPLGQLSVLRLHHKEATTVPIQWGASHKKRSQTFVTTNKFDSPYSKTIPGALKRPSACPRQSHTVMPPELNDKLGFFLVILAVEILTFFSLH